MAQGVEKYIQWEGCSCPQTGVYSDSLAYTQQVTDPRSSRFPFPLFKILCGPQLGIISTSRPTESHVSRSHRQPLTQWRQTLSISSESGRSAPCGKTIHPHLVTNPLFFSSLKDSLIGAVKAQTLCVRQEGAGREKLGTPGRPRTKYYLKGQRWSNWTQKQNPTIYAIYKKWVVNTQTWIGSK